MSTSNRRSSGTHPPAGFRRPAFVPPGDQPPYRGAESVRRWMEPEAFQQQQVRRFEPVIVGEAKVLELEVVTWSVWT